MKYLKNEYGYYLTRDKGLANNTINAYLRDLEQYINHLTKYRNIKYPNTIKKADVQAFLKALKQKNITAKSITRHLSSIKGYHQILLL